MKQLFILLFVLSTNFYGAAQDMAFFADVMVNAEVASHRILAADKFEILFQKAIEEEASFENKFDDLPFIFIRYPEHQSFRTITWQIDRGAGKFEYKGYFQLEDGTIYPLAGGRGQEALSAIGAIKWSKWRGGIIYKILTIPSGSENKDYLLTYRQLDEFTKAKTLESVQITKDNILLSSEQIFGANKGGSNSNRITLSYSADSHCNIRYQPEAQQIVFDNLVSVAGRLEGQGPTLAPDGSYKAYTLQSDGTWNYQDKLFDQKFVSPPRGGVSSDGKDILGRVKKNR